MGLLDIISSPDPSRALYLALRGNQTASRAADVFEGGFRGAMEGLGNLGHAATIPARALAAGATNLAGMGPRADISDVALYGRDLNTGRAPEQYGDLLAGTLEDAGELQPGGLASKLVRLAGNAVLDPAMAPAMLTGADAIGALGRSRPPVAPGAPGPAPRAAGPAPSGPPPLPPGARPATGPPQAGPPPRTSPPPLPPGARPPSGPPQAGPPPRPGGGGGGPRGPSQRSRDRLLYGEWLPPERTAAARAKAKK